MTVSLKHSHKFKDYNHDKQYRVMKTYELEIQQDEEIEKSQRKDKDSGPCRKEQGRQMMRKLFQVHQEMHVCEGKSKLSKGKRKG